MTFNVLKASYIPIGDWFAVKWQIVGQAKSMEEAKKLYGGSPVLEESK